APAVMPLGATRLDISLDDADGDVVAGIAAWTHADVLTIELLWVHDALRGQGIGRALVQMAEIEALARRCQTALVSGALRPAFYQYLGYCVTARLLSFPVGVALYALHKPLVADACACGLAQ
ncbi:MAG: GNAT family N-acetyltransferase, partial [Armatimonadetes bacterium]|nr:GNAT family N-acetyltransferase [Anaerolineae bacterium]